ncbi:FarB protein [Blastomyces gilchristii SLH14081]|uniref:FarB protein n=1 Tax=Blastomyces gilchristii (strain SLH14081) TaxID=559298 RepID=A0A179UE98_BLAGS|nr:FarB protein [Blastomyces gilchristii SLH14081]OAT05341.1 FarB protein [Blastomyces gilchristii SLH14081]
MAANTPTPNMHPQRKRKAEDDARPGTKRPTQKRASAACRSCRARKVRCDVLLKSTPCTNCRLDGAECIIADSKRTKFARTADGTTLLIGNSQKDAGNKDWNAAAVVAPNNDPINASDRGSVERSNEYDSSDNELQQKSASDPIIAHDMILSNMFSIMHQLFGPAPETIHKQPDIDLPRFIKQHSMELESDDFSYLHKKGAFEIPHFAFRNELLKSYVNYVHVYMPFLDLEDFLQTIYENTGRKRISLLLFQAVMFAGTAFVDIKHLRMAGYQSRRAARKAFFQRVRALYDLDYEEDQIIVIQTLMLMSYWFETPHDQKDCFHWIGISLALSRLNGMHLDITTAVMDPNTRRMWRRTWWILYSRDKTIPLGMRRPARLREDDYDLDMVSLDDFELQPLPNHLRQMIGGSETLSNQSYQQVLALLFIEKVKLCRHLHQALALQYRTPVHDVEMMRGSRMALIPKTEATDIAQIRYHDEGLDKWFANTPKETRYSPQFACELSEAEEVLHLHRSMLKLLYLATRSTLHLPQIIRALPNKLQPSELHQESLEKVRCTAAEITAIAQDLHHLNLTRYLPSNGATPLLSAIAAHVIDLSSSGSAINLTSLNSLHQCLQTILRLREIYPVADSITYSIEKIMRDMGVQHYQQQQQQQYSHNPSRQQR